jgi:Cysteine-rich CPCC
MKFTCPCCGYKTFSHPPNGSFEICEVCFWEDEEAQLEDPDFRGGANKVSLRQGQMNFLAFGASEKQMIINVRPPKVSEPKDQNWKPLDPVALIQDFPILTGSQVAMLRIDLYIGHVVDVNMELATKKEQEVWTIYDLINSAIGDAFLIVKEFDHIECSIFDKDRNLLRLIQPS